MGEEFAALMRIATNAAQVHPVQRARHGRALLFRHSGQRSLGAEAEGNLYRNKVAVINYRSSDVHSTGHGNTGELIWMNKQINSKFFMPGYGYYSMTYSHAESGSSRLVERATR